MATRVTFTAGCVWIVDELRILSKIVLFLARHGPDSSGREDRVTGSNE